MQDEHVSGVVSKGNTLALECEDDTAAQFAENTVSLIDADADLNGIGNGTAFDLVYAQNDRVGDGDVLEG